MAGIQIVGAIGIKVTPDLTGFRQKLQAELSKIKDDFTVNINVDTARATSQMAAWQARQEANTVEKKFTLDRSAFDLASDTIANFTKSALGNLAKAGLGVTALVGSFNLLASLGSLLASSVGIIGLIPGALVGAGAALAVIKLGMDGIKEAFKDAAPAAQELKKAVSDTFRRELIPGVQAAKAIIPELKSGFSGLAKTLSGIANSVLTAFKTDGLETFKSTLSTVDKIFGNLGKAVAPLVLAFLNIAKIGAEMFEPLTRGAGTAAEQFLEFTKSAEGIKKIKEWIQGGIDAFKALFEIVKTVGSIIASVVKAFSSTGDSLGSSLLEPLRALDDFLKSSTGREILRQIADAFRTIASAVTTVFKQAMQSIGPALLPALDAVKQFITQLRDVLVPIIKFIGPFVVAAFKFIADNMDWIGPVLLGIGAVVLAIKGIGIAITAVSLIMSANPIVLAALAIAAVAAVIIANWDKLKPFFQELWEVIKGIFMFFFGDIYNFIKNNWETIKELASSIWGALKEFFLTIWSLITGDGKAAWEHFKNFLGQVWKAIKAGAELAWEAFLAWLASIPGRIMQFFWELPGKLFNIGVQILQGLWNGLKSMAARVTEWLGGFTASLGSMVGKLLGIRSPSRVFAELGMYTGLGFLEGLQSTESKIQSAMASIVAPPESRMSMQASVNGNTSGSVLLQAGNSLEEKITAALSSWEVRLDARGVGTLAHKGSSLNSIR